MQPQRAHREINPHLKAGPSELPNTGGQLGLARGHHARCSPPCRWLHANLSGSLKGRKCRRRESPTMSAQQARIPTNRHPSGDAP